MNHSSHERGLPRPAAGSQGELFGTADLSFSNIVTQKDMGSYSYIPMHKVSLNKETHHQLHNRRYIGNKHKLIDWIFSKVLQKCKGTSFADIFAGTGSVAAVASQHFSKVIVNDFLYSNNIIYNAFFGEGDWSATKLAKMIDKYNMLASQELPSNYFSDNFGGKYFSVGTAKKIGFIREDIKQNVSKLSARENDMLLASLLYSMDKIANTVGHYDAYFRKDNVVDEFLMKPIEPITPIEAGCVSIYREDTNILVKSIQADIIYIDPPYNSRQYSRFYHILENVTKWDKPKLYGTALKPPAENMSDYCRVSAVDRFREMIRDINARYIVVSYNNTYKPKSNSSKNKITLEQMQSILAGKGNTEVFEKDYRHFNAGKTDFNNHKEYLFITEVGDAA